MAVGILLVGLNGQHGVPLPELSVTLYYVLVHVYPRFHIPFPQ
jgi:hypothetical protein